MKLSESTEWWKKKQTPPPDLLFWRGGRKIFAKSNC